MFIVRLLPLVMAKAASVGLFVDIPIISKFAFWSMVAAYLLWMRISRRGEEKGLKLHLMLTIV
jgi:hypothetical protein